MIWIGRGARSHVLSRIRGSWFAVEDRNAPWTAGGLRVAAGEAIKRSSVLSRLWEQFAARRLDRHSTIVAIGGGALLDAVGFAAATYLRGVRLALIPTTLLAQVDASVGGKTAVNLRHGKNLAGSFYPADFVGIDPAFLGTLPPQEIRSGLAESVKCAVIRDPGLFEMLEEGPKRLEEIVYRSVLVKARVVERDEFERGLRMILNYGHTVGHAVERAAQFRIPHGYAVSIGMDAEARMAARLGLCSGSFVERQRRLLDRLGLPTEISRSMDRKVLREAMRQDKKRRDREIRFVLPRRIGAVAMGVRVPERILSACL